MKSLLVVTAVICSVLVATMANPVPEAKPDPDPKTDMELMRIPLDEDKVSANLSKLPKKMQTSTQCKTFY